MSPSKSKGRVLAAGVVWWDFSSNSAFLSVFFLSECWTTFGLKVGEGNLSVWRRKKVLWICCGFFFVVTFFCDMYSERRHVLL